MHPKKVMMGVFGQTSGPLGSSSVFGSTFNSTGDPLGPATSPSFPTQSSVSGGSSTPVFGASSQSFMFGKASGPFRSPSEFGSNSSPSPNPFTPNSSGNTTFPSFRTQGSIFRESSTGVFGRTSSSLPSSPATFSFGIASTAASGSSAALGPASTRSNNAFAFKPFRSAPAFVSETTGSNFTRTPTGFLRATGPVNPFALSTPISSGGLGSCAHYTGTKIASYSHTIVKEGESNRKLISISAMPIYGGKSHEELRCEGYELKSGGKNNSQGNRSIGISSTFTNERPTFSFSSLTNPVTSTWPPFTASIVPTSSSTVIPLAPIITTPAVSTNMNTSLFCAPCFSSPAPLPNSGLFSTQTQVSNASESAPSVFEQGLFGSLDSWTSFDNNSSLNPKPLTPLGVWSNHPSVLTPDAPVKQSPSTFGCDLFNVNNAFVQPAIAQAPSMGTGLGQTVRAQSPVTVPAFSTGDNIGFTVSSDSSQPSRSQPSLPIDKATDSIVAVKDPFGPQSVFSCPPVSHLDGPSIIQHGISSMPVWEKPATARISSFLPSRRSSLRPLTVHVRKYRPKNVAPKAAFFNLAEETRSTQKAYHLLVPRESPRSVFCTSTELDHVTTTKDALPSNEASSPLYEDDGENAVIDMKLLIPKLQRSDYYTEPEIREVMEKERTEAGFCSHVKDFVVGRRGYGWVKFEGETDVRGLDLDTLIHFNAREVIVYMDEKAKPPVGQGLNKPAEVTLLNIRCVDRKTGKEYGNKKMVDKFTEKLRKAAEEQGAEFVSFVPVKGEWKFRVKHF